jgi:hypothetical protein
MADDFAADILAIEAEAREGYVPAALSPEWHAELATVAAEAREALAAELVALRRAVEAMLALPVGPYPWWERYHDVEAALGSPPMPERRCIECGEPWPCKATVLRVKDGIPHRIGVATREEPSDRMPDGPARDDPEWKGVR